MWAVKNWSIIVKCEEDNFDFDWSIYKQLDVK